MTTVVITAARNTKPPNTPRAITAPRFNLAWWALLGGCSSTRKGPEGSGTIAPIPAWAWSTPLPDISLSCGWSLLASLITDEGNVGLFKPTLGLFEIVSFTVAGSSAVWSTFLTGEEVVLVATVVALVVVLILEVRYGRTFCVDDRTVARVVVVTVVRGSSDKRKFVCWILYITYIIFIIKLNTCASRCNVIVQSGI